MPRVVVIVLVVALAIYALVDLYQSHSGQTRLMPRWLWVASIVCVPGLGALGWLLAGRPAKPLGPDGRPPAPPRAPDDDPDFLRGL